MAGFSSNPTMPSPPPLVSVASSENHPHYLGNLNQHHLPDVCVPVTAAVLNTPNITQGQMNGVAIRQTAVSHQAMILSPATSPARIDPYNIQLLAANTIHDVDTISTKQLTPNQFLNWYFTPVVIIRCFLSSALKKRNCKLFYLYLQWSGLL